MQTPTAQPPIRATKTKTKSMMISVASSAHLYVSWAVFPFSKSLKTKAIPSKYAFLKVTLYVLFPSKETRKRMNEWMNDCYYCCWQHSKNTLVESLHCLQVFPSAFSTIWQAAGYLQRRRVISRGQNRTGKYMRESNIRSNDYFIDTPPHSCWIHAFLKNTLEIKSYL